MAVSYLHPIEYGGKKLPGYRIKIYLGFNIYKEELILHIKKFY
ncbi:hypothetical protein CBF_2240 [Clostridium botulinum F str. 230613]|uniref:Uncharacterized protein n=1 Tax=Clostridium botulinum (strain Langeland / NCTC 10281 / Type F) TaxID=441772 RepID=A7GFE4_CLOBL|nr:hypothetical protein CLI_2254 [Clostridium botulinum F str. Langeland]ADF99905.1 hypothetical protein CBF_2240 [Clostridium botulinum F str. 230613]